MDADLVSFADDATLLVAMEQRDDARHIEGCRHRMPCEQFQDARHANPIAILSPRHATDRFAAVAQLVRLVIGIEGKREGAARTTFPALRTKTAAGADLVDETAPMLFRPLPGFKLCHVVHDGPPNSFLPIGLTPAGRSDGYRLPRDPGGVARGQKITAFEHQPTQHVWYGLQHLAVAPLSRC